MRIPSRFQGYLDDDYEPTEKLRKGNGRMAAYRSSNPNVRKNVRLASTAESQKVRRAAKSLKVTVRTRESLKELRLLAYNAHVAKVALEGRKVPAMGHLKPENLDRITVNFIRHSRTEYDKSLSQGHGASPLQHATFSQEMKVLCLEEITQMFPDLALECERQTLVVFNDLGRSADLIDIDLQAQKAA